MEVRALKYKAGYFNRIKYAIARIRQTQSYAAYLRQGRNLLSTSVFSRTAWENKCGYADYSKR
jgi:hypothetical protein